VKQNTFKPTKITNSMEIKVLSEDKKTMDVEVGNLTIVELLRVYLNKEGAKMAAWRREHPSKNPVLHIEGENPKKLLQKAIEAVQKELESLEADFKKMK
jgi:DNA-directed RNA polymerase subunit L